MALIKQTIEGLETANTYINISNFDTYHTARGNDISSLDDTTKEQLIIKAMDYLESVYYGFYKGVETNLNQSTLFPRYIDGEDVLPKQILEAQCILALKANGGELLTDTEQQVIKEKVGSLEVEYSENSSQTKRYLSVYNLLKKYMIGSQNSKKVLRG